MIQILRFELTESAPMFALAGTRVKSAHPLTFEQLSQDYGFVLYRTAPRKASNAQLEITDLRDYAVVFEGDRRLGTLDRRLAKNRCA